MGCEVSYERLEDMCELVIDCPHSTPRWTDTGIVVLRNQNIRNGELDLSNPSFTDEEHFYSRVRRAVPRAGDIVFTREAPMGEVCLIPGNLKCCLGQRQVLLRAKPEVDPRYLFWALQSQYVQDQISWNEGTGTTVSNVRIPVLKELKIPRHVCESEIAGLLSGFAKKITLNTQINQTLEQMAQALFKSWFVDFDPVIDNALEAGNPIPEPMAESAARRQAMRAAGNESAPARLPDETRRLFPDRFEEDEKLGWVPAGWAAQQLDKVIKLAYGKALKKSDRQEGLVPVYGSGGVTGFHHVPIVKGPGIIVGRKGTVGSLYWEDSDFFPIDTVFYVQPREGVALEYCFELLKTLNLENMNTDAAVPGLNRNNVYRLMFSLPEEGVIKEFSKIVSSFRGKQKLISYEIKVLAQLRDTLLPKLLSGELTLEVAEDAECEAEEVVA